MKKIVGFASVAIVVTVGTYLAARALGASDPAFAAAFTTLASSVAAFTVLLVAAFAAAFTTAAFATAFAFAAIAAFGTFGAAFAAFAAFGAAFAAAEQEDVKFWWVFTAYMLEALAIGGALTVGSAGWSIAIALAGVLALLVLWRFAPEPTKEQISVATPEHNGA